MVNKAKKSHWLDGERQQREEGLIRESLKGTGRSFSDAEIKNIAYARRTNRMESEGYFPTNVLAAGVETVGALRRVPALKEILAKGKSLTDADKCDPTLRSLIDAWLWLHKAGFALDSGLRHSEQMNTAIDLDALRAAGVQAVQNMSRAVSFAYYAGVACGELKARARIDEMHGSARNPKRKGRFLKLREATIGEFRKFLGRNQTPTNDELRDAVAQQSNGVKFVDDYFIWTDGEGVEKRTSDRSWQNLVTKVRKSITL